MKKFMLFFQPNSKVDDLNDHFPKLNCNDFINGLNLANSNVNSTLDYYKI